MVRKETHKSKSRSYRWGAPQHAVGQDDPPYPIWTHKGKSCFVHCPLGTAANGALSSVDLTLVPSPLSNLEGSMEDRSAFSVLRKTVSRSNALLGHTTTSVWNSILNV